MWGGQATAGNGVSKGSWQEFCQAQWSKAFTLYGFRCKCKECINAAERPKKNKRKAKNSRRTNRTVLYIA